MPACMVAPKYCVGIFSYVSTPAMVPSRSLQNSTSCGGHVCPSVCMFVTQYQHPNRWIYSFKNSMWERLTKISQLSIFDFRTFFHEEGHFISGRKWASRLQYFLIFKLGLGITEARGSVVG